MIAVTARQIFDGTQFLTDHFLFIEKNRIKAVLPLTKKPPKLPLVDFKDKLISPGFLDLQVNGGGGIDFTDTPDIATAEKIASAHRQFGTTAILPTLITSSMGTTLKALHNFHQTPVTELAAKGLLGLHLEGPFLNTEKAGIHDPAHIIDLTEGFCQKIEKIKPETLLITLAPEKTSGALLRRLAALDILLSAGHSNATSAEIKSAFKHGITTVTHLYNAMSGLDHRRPGVAHAALTDSDCFAGLIADLHHISPEMIQFAFSHKGAEKLYLVTDAVAPAASHQNFFDWRGERLTVTDGKLQDSSGRLAGAVLTLDQALRNCHFNLNIPLLECLKMVTSTPANFLQKQNMYGCFKYQSRADMVILNPKDLTVEATYLSEEIEESLEK